MPILSKGKNKNPNPKSPLNIAVLHANPRKAINRRKKKTYPTADDEMGDFESVPKQEKKRKRRQNDADEVDIMMKPHTKIYGPKNAINEKCTPR